jgi:asparagine synthase (glutamine-hydrolysing)
MAEIVPHAILDSRTKVGFNAPIKSLLDMKDPDTRAWLLDDGPIFEHVRRDRIESMMSMDEMPNSTSKFLFSFVCSKVFLAENSQHGV